MNDVRFGPGSDDDLQLWLDEVQCNGYEVAIEDCGHAGWAVTDCDHNEDAGVVCVAGEI